MKKVAIIAILAISTAGCSTYSQQGEMIGAMAGAVIGSQVGGGMGQIAATVIGAGIGANAGRTVGAGLDAQRSGQTTIVYQPAVGSAYGPDYSVCDQYERYAERISCRNGVRRGYQNELKKREREAYQAGMQSQRY